MPSDSVREVPDQCRAGEVLLLRTVGGPPPNAAAASSTAGMEPVPARLLYATALNDMSSCKITPRFDSGTEHVPNPVPVLLHNGAPAKATKAQGSGDFPAPR